MTIFNLGKPNEQHIRSSLFIGIAIWFLHMNLLNALISVSCKWGWNTSPLNGLTGLQFVELTISLAAMLGMLFLIYLPWRYWWSFQSKKTTNNPHLLEDTEEDRAVFMAFITMLLNGFFFLFLIATFVPMFTLKTCGQA